MTRREVRQMKKAVLALPAVLALVFTASALGEDFSQGKGAKAAPHWKVVSLGSGHRTQKPAQAFADGIGFVFGTTPDPRLFLTDSSGSGLLGDLTGKTLTATFTITGTATAFAAGEGPPQNDCPTPASVRLYLERKFKGQIMNSDQWWSTPRAYTLTSLVGNTLTLVVPLDTANWTDRGFELASDVPTDFAAAVANVGAVGLSFGGGCFLPTGAFPTDGTASFVLKSYSVS
jgi:hypothetical protein